MVDPRKPNKEIVEDIIRQQADNSNGLLNLPKKREIIQGEYKETVRGVSMDAQSVSHDQLRAILNEFSEDDNRDIYHVNDEVYFVSPFNDAKAEERVQKKIIEVYHTDFIFTGDRLRSKFNVPMNSSDFFLKKLQEKGLITLVRSSPSVFTIGDELRKKRDEPGLEKQLQAEATNGTINNSAFEDIIEAPAADEIIAIFEKEKGYIVDLDGEYLVIKAIDDYVEYLSRQVKPGIQAEFDKAKDVMLLSDYNSKVKNEIREVTDALSQVPHEISSKIVSGVQEKLKESRMLGLHATTTDTNQEVVVTPSFEEEVDKEAEGIYEEIKNESYRQAQRFYDDIDEHIDELSIAGGSVVNEYYRTAVRRNARQLVDQRKFKVSAESE